ncbi:MAG TPA: triose-phosphate isomerase [Paraburkholderia sp.]
MNLQQPCEGKLVVGNWKMHGTRTDNQARFEALSKSVHATECVQAVICVPFPYLFQAQDVLSGSTIGWGAQDISAQSHGAYTGEVSAQMVGEFGCRYAIIGHSERRSYHGETSSVIALKARRALEHGLIPIICVGESLEHRECGTTELIISTQVNDVLGQMLLAESRRVVIAYEPVWAIGTGRTATPTEARDVHAFIRNLLTARDERLRMVPLIYGGSVRASNASALFSQPYIDGALVGGASLDATEFAAICQAAAAGDRV